MGAICDGCHLFLGVPVKTINAKKVFPKFCNVPIEESATCTNDQCVYCIDAECCVEFQFCAKCMKDKALLKRVFENFGKIIDE